MENGQIEIKVGKDSRVGKVAEAIKNEYRKGKKVTIRSIGSKAGWNAVKAVAISKLTCSLEFDQIMLEDNPAAVLILTVK